jgi:ketosteroid isomerase-like protein
MLLREILGRAMSQENVELVRRAFDALERAFDAYWKEPRSIAEAIEADDWPEWSEAFSFIHPDVVWQTVLLGNTFRGHRECARAWDDFLRWAADYRPVLDDVEDLVGDRVFAVVGLHGQSKDGGGMMDARFYDVFTVRDGLIVRLEEYTTRAEALEAAGRASDANVESVRAFWEAWTPGEELPMSIFDPGVAYEDSTLPDHVGETYRGHAGLTRAAERWLDPYESLKIELERIVGSGDRLVSIHHARAKARYSGIEDDGPLAYLWIFRDGKVIHLRSYRDPAEALAAAGLEA